MNPRETPNWAQPYEQKEQKFLLAIVLGAILGALLGVFYPEEALRTGFLGEIFLNALKMMVLPLIVTSMIVGVTGLGDVRELGSLGWKTFAYYLLTTALAVLVGIVLVSWLEPGRGGEVPLTASLEKVKVGEYSPGDVLLGLIRPNLVQAAAEYDILPLIVASLIFGIGITLIGDKGRVLVQFFDALNDTVMVIVKGVIYLTPVGIFGLMAHQIGKAGGAGAFTEMMGRLGSYCLVVILGLLIHGLLILPAILFFLGRRNPLRYLFHLMKAILTAFATSSSSATLPVTLECVKEEAKLSKKVSDVVLPIGATVNMDGTALYEAVAAVFIAQSYGMELTMGQLLVIFLTATLAAIGAAGIPQAGLVTMVLVLRSVGLPVEGIGLILAIDWFLDRCRTTVNVWGDAVGAAVVARLERFVEGEV